MLYINNTEIDTLCYKSGTVPSGTKKQTRLYEVRRRVSLDRKHLSPLRVTRPLKDNHINRRTHSGFLEALRDTVKQ